MDSDLAVDATTLSALGAYGIGYPDGGSGGDTPELGSSAVKDAADNASWRPGANRFVVALGDAPFKEGGTEIQSDADVTASLTGANADLFGLDFAGGSGLTGSVEELGGTAFDATADPGEIVSAITAGVELGFADYSEVTIGDLGAAVRRSTSWWSAFRPIPGSAMAHSPWATTIDPKIARSSST